MNATESKRASETMTKIFRSTKGDTYRAAVCEFCEEVSVVRVKEDGTRRDVLQCCDHFSYVHLSTGTIIAHFDA